MKKVEFIERYGQEAYDRKLECQRDYNDTHKEQSRKYYVDNRDHINERNREYYENNRNEISEHRHEHYVDNKNKVNERRRERYDNNKDEILERNREWLKTTAGKAARKRKQAKRRYLGFEPINEPFDGCEGHHVDNNTVIYIPKDLHRSVWHCLSTCRGMHEINNLAFAYVLNN